MKKIVLLLLLMGFTSPQQASASVSLKGSRSAMAAENKAADKQELSRIRDDRHLQWFKKNKRLVPIPTTRCLKIDPRLKSKYRYVRPMTRVFLLQLSNRFCREFKGASLQVNSAVRTIVYQHELTKTNANAARGKSSKTRSSHLTGATIDLAKLGLTQKQLRWMRKRLKLNEKVGRALVTEEHRQAVFHIMVLH